MASLYLGRYDDNLRDCEEGYVKTARYFNKVAEMNGDLSIGSFIGFITSALLTSYVDGWGFPQMKLVLVLLAFILALASVFFFCRFYDASERREKARCGIY